MHVASMLGSIILALVTVAAGQAMLRREAGECCVEKEDTSINKENNVVGVEV